MSKNGLFYLIIICTCFSSVWLNAQVSEGAYLGIEEFEGEQILHELKLDQGYLSYSIYKKDAPSFIKTMGGFYQVENNLIVVLLEFNSAYEKDSVRQLSIPYELSEKELILHLKNKQHFSPIHNQIQELDGQWLFGTRGPDKGQERRGDSKPRKTLNFLLNGRFQWIAYNTETFQFYGTGGGSYSSKDGVYSESIEYFSRDNNRVGATLNFEYELIGKDWHHKGKNSKGEPMYEIWMKRIIK